jgi:hypothetical protein
LRFSKVIHIGVKKQALNKRWGHCQAN